MVTPGLIADNGRITMSMSNEWVLGSPSMLLRAGGNGDRCSVGLCSAVGARLASLCERLVGGPGYGVRNWFAKGAETITTIGNDPSSASWTHGSLKRGNTYKGFEQKCFLFNKDLGRL